MTRLTNGCSSKVENLSAVVALHITYMNFARPLQHHRLRPLRPLGHPLESDGTIGGQHEALG